MERKENKHSITGRKEAAWEVRGEINEPSSV
jgi:hypothetical protein